MARPAILGAVPDEPDRLQIPSASPTTPRELQAAVEGVAVGDRVTFMGEQYRIADKVGLMPLMRFAHAARKGTNASDMEGLAAIYDMLTDCFMIAPPCEACEMCTADPPRPDDCPQFDPGDWPRFQEDATKKKAEADDLLEVVSQTIELLSSRPTRRPSDSSAGPSKTSAKSTVSSSPTETPDGAELVSVDELMRRASS